MIDSLSLLSRKGPLGAVLVAAYCQNRLKKAQVIATDVPFSVRMIIDEGLPAFTYRILGYLLLGVVRIYSLQVEYVLLDCNRMLQNAKQAAVKGKEPHEYSLIGPNWSITLPESLELDKFIFEDMQAERRHHVLPEEEIMLKDSWEDAQALKYSSTELHDRVSIYPETFSDFPPPDDKIFSPHSVEISLDDNLMFDDTDIESNIATLIQKLSLPVESCEAEMFNLPVPCLSCPVMFGVNTDDRGAPKSEHSEAESSQRQRKKGAKISLTIERTPEMKCSEPPDSDQAAQSEVLPTPINIENVPVIGKRKRLLDEQVVLTNKTFKENLSYSGDLLRKQRKVPHTALSVWKHEIRQDWTQPLIHCAFMGQNYRHCEDKVTSEEVPPNLEASIVLDAMASTDDKITDNEKELITEPIASVANAVKEHNEIAPETPHKNPLVKGFPLDDISEKVREVSSSNTSERELSVEHHEELVNEDNISVSSEADFDEPDGWSSSTRQAVQDLRTAFYARNGQELQQVKLQDSLKGASKNKSAKLFYDILVLSNRCMINVEQHKPYGDIFVTKSTRWDTW